MEKSEKSTNVFQKAREKKKLTLNQAADLLHWSKATLERIEDDESYADPEDVERLVELYEDPFLKNYYCSTVCPLGKNYEQPVSEDGLSLSNTTLGVVSALNSFMKCKDVLFSIVADGEISEEETEAFDMIKKNLDSIDTALMKLRLIVHKKTHGRCGGKASKEKNR